MKKVCALILVIFLLMSVASVSSYSDNALKKLGRGLANIGTAPLEIFKGISDVNEEHGVFAAFTWGILQGVFNTGKRAVVGVYETATFPVPLPKGYEPIIEDPEFFLEKD